MKRLKILLSISLVILIVSILLIGIHAKSNKKIETEGKQEEVNSFKLQEDDIFKKEYKVGNILFHDIRYYYQDGSTYIQFKIENRGEKEEKIGLYTITVYNQEDKIFTYADIENNGIKSKEIREKALSTIGDYSKINRIEIEIKGEIE